MSRVFSFRDLRLIPALSKIPNEIEMLFPSNDALMNEYLGQLGFNLNYAVQYVPAKHRDMQGKVAIGFRAVGEISTERSYVTSHMCSITERLIAASKTDPSLCRELSSLMGNSINLRDDVDSPDGGDDYPEELIEPDYQEVMNKILELENIRDAIRGSAHDEAGALKLPGTYT